jgi:hypothetical protein
MRRALSYALAVLLTALTQAPAAADGDRIESLPSPLYAYTSGEKTVFALERDAYERIAPLRRVRLKDFPLPGKPSEDLELEQTTILLPGARLEATTDEGETTLAFPRIAVFRGHLAGRPDSRVVLSVSPRGMQAIVDAPEEGFVLAPSGARDAAQDIIHEASAKTEPGLLDLPESARRNVQDTLYWGPERQTQAPPRASGQFRVCRLALECDYEFWCRFNDLDAALDYLYILFTAMGDIYERDLSVKLALTYINIWTTANDPYSYVGGESTGLKEFVDYWRANHNPGQPGFVERDLAHLLSSRGVGAWGNVGVLCDYNNGFSISGGIALLPGLADRVHHDIMYAAHEIGHNFNGIHTHCLIDPSTGDYVDKCVTEPNCNQTVDCSTAPSSIMSYCDNCPGGGANVLEKFDDPNISRILNHVAGSCLRIARNPCYVDQSNNSGTEDGDSSHPYNTIKEGVEAVLPSGTVIVTSGSYPGSITLWQPMTLQANGGGVTIGQ